jgi:ABC-type branched-subunit amino acid transport system substrate-binding protein
VKKAGSADAAKVRDALASIDGFTGVTGTLRYPNGSHIPRKDACILEIKVGSRRMVRHLIPAEVPAP